MNWLFEELVEDLVSLLFLLVAASVHVLALYFAYKAAAPVIFAVLLLSGILSLRYLLKRIRTNIPSDESD